RKVRRAAVCSKPCSAWAYLAERLGDHVRAAARAATRRRVARQLDEDEATGGAAKAVADREGRADPVSCSGAPIAAKVTLERMEIVENASMLWEVTRMSPVQFAEKSREIGTDSSLGLAPSIDVTSRVGDRVAGDGCTETPNRPCVLLSGADTGSPPPVRGVARVLRRASTVRRRRARLRLHPDLVPRAVPPLPARPRACLLHRAAPRAAAAAEEVACPPPHPPDAQA